MVRRQVIVQLDHDLVESLDRASEEDGVSRSELIRRAATALLQARETVRLDRQYIESYRRVPPDPVLLETTARIAREMAEDW